MKNFIVNPDDYSQFFKTSPQCKRTAITWLKHIRRYQNKINILKLDKLQNLKPNDPNFIKANELINYQINDWTEQRNKLLNDLTGSFKEDVETELQLETNKDYYVFLEKNKPQDFQSFCVRKFFTACKTGKLKDVKYSLELQNYNPNLFVYDVNSDDRGPVFHFAVKSGNIELVKYFVERWHVDVNSIGTYDGDNSSPLSIAIEKGYAEIVNYLLAKGADVNLNGTDSRTLLDKAISLQHTEIVKSLLDNNTKITVAQFYLALESGNLATVKLLIKHCPDFLFLPMCELSNKAFIEAAVRSGNIELVDYLVNKQQISIFSPLPFAKNSTNQDEIIQKLLIAAMRSHNLNMLRYLVDTHYIDVKQAIQNDLDQTNYTRGNFCFSILGSIKNCNFLVYLLEEQHLLLDEKTLDNFIANAKYSGVEINAYLESLREHSEEDKKLLQTLGKQGLSALDTPSLSYLHQTNLLSEQEKEKISSEINWRHSTVTNNRTDNSPNASSYFSYRDLLFSVPQKLSDVVQEKLNIHFRW